MLHLPVDRLELAEQRLNATGAQAALLDQRRDATPSPYQFVDQTGPDRLRRGRLHRLPHLPVQVEQACDGADVDRNAGGDLLLRVDLGGRDAHGPVEGEAPGVDLAKGVHRTRTGVVALEDLAAEDHPRGLDLLGETDLLLAGQQGDGAHLREVHPDGIVDAPGTLLGEGLLDHRLGLGVVEDLLFACGVLGLVLVAVTGAFGVGVAVHVLAALVLLRIRLRLVVDHLDLGSLGGLAGIVALELQFGLKRRDEAGQSATADLRLVDQTHRVGVKQGQQLVETLRIDEVVRKAGVEFLVADPGALHPDFDEFAEDRLQFGDHKAHGGRAPALRGDCRGCGQAGRGDPESRPMAAARPPPSRGGGKVPRHREARWSCEARRRPQRVVPAPRDRPRRRRVVREDRRRGSDADRRGPSGRRVRHARTLACR